MPLLVLASHWSKKEGPWAEAVAAMEVYGLMSQVVNVPDRFANNFRISDREEPANTHTINNGRHVWLRNITMAKRWLAATKVPAHVRLAATNGPISQDQGASLH